MVRGVYKTVKEYAGRMIHGIRVAHLDSQIKDVEFGLRRMDGEYQGIPVAQRYSPRRLQKRQRLINRKRALGERYHALTGTDPDDIDEMVQDSARV